MFTVTITNGTSYNEFSNEYVSLSQKYLHVFIINIQIVKTEGTTTLHLNFYATV